MIFTAFVLNNLGLSVVICDLTDNKKCSYMFEKDLSETVNTYRNIDIVFKITGNLDSYDYAFILFSENADHKLFNYVDMVFINTSTDKDSMIKTFDLINKIHKNNVYLVVRDIVGRNINKKYIKKCMDEKGICVNYIYDIPLDYMDYEYRIIMDYEFICKFKYLSKRYQKVMEKTVVNITREKCSSVQKALVSARGGRLFDNRIFG